MGSRKLRKQYQDAPVAQLDKSGGFLLIHRSEYPPNHQFSDHSVPVRQLTGLGVA
jgi:hypothetical protein